MKKQGLIYKKFISKIEKVIYLVKKSIYFAWHRHHFLIPPKVLNQNNIFEPKYILICKKGDFEGLINDLKYNVSH